MRGRRHASFSCSQRSTGELKIPHDQLSHSGLIRSAFGASNVTRIRSAAPANRMEIVLSGGDRIIVGADVDATALARLIGDIGVAATLRRALARRR